MHDGGAGTGFNPYFNLFFDLARRQNYLNQFQQGTPFLEYEMRREAAERQRDDDLESIPKHQYNIQISHIRSTNLRSDGMCAFHFRGKEKFQDVGNG